MNYIADSSELLGLISVELEDSKDVTDNKGVDTVTLTAMIFDKN